MARLNDAPSEGFECLKRRFIRQNKELVIHNSTQSLKIRALESEVARLVRENGMLYEENTHLKAQLQEKPEAGNFVMDLDSIKQKVEAHGRELMASLEALTQSRNQDHRHGSKSSQVALISSKRVWPTRRQSALDYEAPWKLPAIAENNCHSEPMEMHEGSEVHSHASFVTSIRESPGYRANLELSINAKSTNVEADSSRETQSYTRKRRRSISNVDSACIDPVSVEMLSLDPKIQDLPPLINQCDPKDGISTRNVDGVTGVIPTERRSGSHSLSSTKARRGRQEKSRPERRPLSTKPVNTDPVISPRKRKYHDDLVAGKAYMKDNGNEVSVADVSNRPGVVNLLTDSGKVDTETCERGSRYPHGRPNSMDDCCRIKLEPISPASLDLISQSSERAPGSRRESRDTPPPPNVGEASEGGARRERRIRTAVNYAEPNLVSKMRRPTKDFVDAVVRGDRRGSFRHFTTPEDSLENPQLSSHDTDPNDMKEIAKAERRSSHIIQPSKADGQRTKLNTTSVTTGDDSLVESIDHTKVSLVSRSLDQMQTMSRNQYASEDIFDCIESPPRPRTNENRLLSNAENPAPKSRMPSGERSDHSSLHAIPSITSKARPRRQTVGERSGDRDGKTESTTEHVISQHERQSSSLGEARATERRQVSLRRRSTVI